MGGNFIWLRFLTLRDAQGQYAVFIVGLDRISIHSVRQRDLFSAALGGHANVVRVLLGAGAEILPVQGIELRGMAIKRNSKRHEAILKMLDGHKRN